MITTDHSPSQPPDSGGTDAARGVRSPRRWGFKGAHPQSRGERAARSRTRGKLLLLTALLILAVGLCLRALRQTAWYQEWRFSRMSLAALQRERGGRLDNPRLLYYVGLRLNQQGRFAEADAYLRNAVGLDPDTPRLRDAWAQALVRSGRITAAFGELREFAGRHPDSAQAHLLLGKFYLTQDSMVRATEELTQAVKQEPDLGEGWSYLADAQSGLGHYPDAVKASEKAVALRPRSVTDHLGLALLLLRIGQMERARAVFAQAAALAPQSAAVQREFARCLLQIGGASALSQAEAEARRALALTADDPGISFILGQVLAAEGRPGEAIPFLQRAATASPFDPVSALALSQAYARAGQSDLARLWEGYYRARNQRAQRKQDLVTAILKSPHDPRPQKEMARMLAQEGDVAGCLRHDAEALRCAPDAPPALAAAANHLTLSGHADAALPLAQRAVEVAPNNPTAREAMGNALLAQGRIRDAAIAYAQAGRGFPDRIKLYQSWLDQYETIRQHSGVKPARALPH